MGIKRKHSIDESDCKEMKYEDLLNISNLFASEFNNSAMHDRVLVFQVVDQEHQDGNVSEPQLPINEEQETLHTGGKENKCTNGISEMNYDKTNCELTQATSISSSKSSTSAKYLQCDLSVNQVSAAGENDNCKRAKKEKEKQVEEDVHMREAEKEAKGVEDEEKEDDGKRKEVAGRVQIYCNGNNTGSDESNSEMNQHKIFVHSCFLAVQSRYFRALFYSGMKESHSKEVIMKIFQSELQPHLTLIEAMYRLDVLNDKDYKLVLKILVLADKYDVNLVRKKCKYVLMSTPFTLEMCEHILEVVKDLPEFDDLLGLLEKFLVKEFTPLDKTWTMDKFIALSEASLTLLFSSNDLAVQCENTVFVALLEWIRSNVTGLTISQSSLLSLVRFEMMTIDFLYDVVQYNVLAKEMPGFEKFLKKGLAYHGFSQERRDELKLNPVPRTPRKDSSPTFTWIIDKNIREELSDSTSVPSSVFWFRGYQMELELRYDSATDSRIYSIYLFALNMSEGSCLNISWKAESDLFKNPVAIQAMYTQEGSGWGMKVETKIRPSEVSEAVSHKVDVRIEFI